MYTYIDIYKFHLALVAYYFTLREFFCALKNDTFYPAIAILDELKFFQKYIYQRAQQRRAILVKFHHRKHGNLRG